MECDEIDSGECSDGKESREIFEVIREGFTGEVVVYLMAE